MNIREILVATDFSENADVAVRAAQGMCLKASSLDRRGRGSGATEGHEGRSHHRVRASDETEAAPTPVPTAQCLWHVHCTDASDMVEAIRDQWLVVTGIIVVIAALVWLMVRR